MGIAITTINIGNLTLASVTSLIAEALGMEDDEETVRPLAATVHKKTDGNAFFVLMFLRSLHDEQMLHFNIGEHLNGRGIWKLLTQSWPLKMWQQ